MFYYFLPHPNKKRLNNNNDNSNNNCTDDDNNAGKETNWKSQYVLLGQIQNESNNCKLTVLENNNHISFRLKPQL